MPAQTTSKAKAEATRQTQSPSPEIAADRLQTPEKTYDRQSNDQVKSLTHDALSTSR